MKLPPIRLQRLYEIHDEERVGAFVLRPEPLPAGISARMTDEEHIARRQAERKAIDAEWASIKAGQP